MGPESGVEFKTLDLDLSTTEKQLEFYVQHFLRERDPKTAEVVTTYVREQKE